MITREGKELLYATKQFFLPAALMGGGLWYGITALDLGPNQATWIQPQATVAWSVFAIGTVLLIVQGVRMHREQPTFEGESAKDRETELPLGLKLLTYAAIIGYFITGGRDAPFDSPLRIVILSVLVLLVLVILKKKLF